MKQISIYYIAKVMGIPPRTISLNVKVLENIPAVKEFLRKKNETTNS